MSRSNILLTGIPEKQNRENEGEKLSKRNRNVQDLEMINTIQN